jgi:hypothetical protein
VLKTYEFTERPWAILASLLVAEEMRETELLIAQRLSPFMVPTKIITCEDLIKVAYSYSIHERTIAQAAEEIQQLYADARFPEITKDCSNLTVPWQIARTLGGYRGWGDGNFDPATIIDSMLYSRIPLGDFLDQLAAFRPLGAPVPQIDEHARRALNQVRIDEYDLDMLLLYDDFGDETYLQKISSLAFVQIAGRIGWSLAEAHRRLARLVPIGLTLEYPQIDFSDEIVCWYDLLVLTMYFDGQAPTISGRIDQAYLEHAAEEIFDATPEQVPEKAALLRKRLRIYAPLFHFELDIPQEDPVG